MSSNTQGRYDRQSLYTEIGAEGQSRIERSRIAVVGVGALGCQEAALLARAGVGRLKLIDRDFVEITNLQRQILYTEQDVVDAVPKAEAARIHLSRANSDIDIEACVTDLSATNIARVLGDVDVIVDGSDNFEVRYLLNDYAIERAIPWIYAAAIGSTGLLMPVLPGQTPCLRCLFEESPPAGSAETCDTAGILGPTTGTIGSLAALEALKIAAGRSEAVLRGLLQLDLWCNDIRSIDVGTPREGCPCCGDRSFPWLEIRQGGTTTELCGRDAVQLTPATTTSFDFDRVKARIRRAVETADNDFLVRFEVSGIEVTLFRDGRAILKGTTDAQQARIIYSRFVGN